MDSVWRTFSSFQRKIAGSAASSSRTAPERVALPNLTQINESLYLVHSPEGRPAVEIIFFHGLQAKGSPDEYFISTWLSRDGSEFWLNWIPAEISGARILTVSYGISNLRTVPYDRLDIYGTGENLLSDFLEAKVGLSGCPVVLVGHSYGGLIIKQLCLVAERQLNTGWCHGNVPELLNNLKGFFFLASPHYGSTLNGFSRRISKGALFGYFSILDIEAARLNDNFRRLRIKYGWRTFGIGESLEVNLGAFRGLIVEEASARLDVDEFYRADEDHFTVCRPQSKRSRNYELLVGFINRCLLEDEAEQSPKTDFPKEFIGLERQTMAVISKLGVHQRLCLVGVQGIGKTTLVEAVYNKIKDNFDYTCFFGEANEYLALEEHPDDLRTKITRSLRSRGGGPGRKVSNNFRWSILEGKKVLIVLDDVVSESQVSVMTEADNFSDDSRVIVTTKKREFLDARRINFHFVEKLDQEDSLRLLCLHAFLMSNVPDEYKGNLGLLNKIAERCGGLPQTLEMVGRYIYTAQKVGFESQNEIGKHQMVRDLGLAIIGSEGSIWPHLEGVSTQSQEMNYSVNPASPCDQVPQDIENGMARSRDDIETQTHHDQEGACKSKVLAQEESKESTIMDEVHDAMANKVDFVAEEDAQKFNFTDEDHESNRGAGRPRNHLGHGKQQEVVKDFVREINGGKSGFIVNKAWFFSLQEPHKGTVMSALRRAAYVEVHQTRTAITYRRIGNSASQVEASDVLDSEMSIVTSFQNKLQLDTVRSDDSSRFGSPRSLPDEGKTALTSSNEKVESFKTALEDTRPHSYLVSTQWLSRLSDHEVEDLNAALSKAGYFQLHKTSTATYFKRHELGNNIPRSRSESRGTAETIRPDSGISSTSQGTKLSLPEKLQEINMDDTKVSSTMQERQKRRLLDCDCVPQYLTVSCTPPFQSQVEASTTSSSQGFGKHVTRHRVGDCYITTPQKLSQRIMNTRVDKSIEIKTIEFEDMETSHWKTYLLVVSVETSLRCCRTSDENAKEVRYEFLKIQGAVKIDEVRKSESGLVLKALLANVVAYITKGEQSEGSEPILLCPRLEELKLLQSVGDSGQTRWPVGLKISAKDPKDSDPGSKTLELHCLEADCTDSDLNQELLFSYNGPGDPRVIFEGDLGADHCQNSLVELNVRYQLEIWHDEQDDSLPHDDFFVGLDRKIMDVDFDCVLEFCCRVT